MAHPMLWPSPWPAEDGGPRRTQASATASGFGLRPGERLEAVSRTAIASTMVVLREPGEVYLLGHTGGDDAVTWVEQIHPHTLETVRRTADMPGGPAWPGGIACHANGSLYSVFGNHAYRWSADLTLRAAAELPRRRPYNSFVVLDDGCLATKDFAGARPGHPEGDGLGASELLVLEPEGLRVVARCELPEPSIARLSADGDDVYVVGDTGVQRVRWDGTQLALDDAFLPVYRTMDGQSFGWDCVVDAGAAWFLDDGAGSERFQGTYRGVGTNEAPLHLVRVGLDDGAVTTAEICGLPGGVIANPPAIDPVRRIAVGYDSGNGVVAAFRFDDRGSLTPLWRADLDHAAHPLRFPDTGELVLGHFDAARGADQVVVVDIETGNELGRVDTGSPVQSVLFPAAGFEGDLYACSFTTVCRITVAGRG